MALGEKPLKGFKAEFGTTLVFSFQEKVSCESLRKGQNRSRRLSLAGFEQRIFPLCKNCVNSTNAFFRKVGCVPHRLANFSGSLKKDLQAVASTALEISFSLTLEQQKTFLMCKVTSDITFILSLHLLVT